MILHYSHKIDEYSSVVTVVYLNSYRPGVTRIELLCRLGVLLLLSHIGNYSSAIAGPTWYALIRCILPTTDLRLLAACIDASNSLRFIVTFTTPTSTS